MTRLVLQRLLLRSDPECFWLYWRKDQPGAALRLEAGATLDLDTYFNSFDETVWRRHTRLSALSVELRLSAPALVQLWRQSRGGARVLLAEAAAAAGQPVSLAIPRPPHPRAAGRLALCILAGDAPVTLQAGAWITEGSPGAIRLMPVICTYNRDAALREVIGRIAADPAVVDAIDGLVIVNNATPGLARRLGCDTMPRGLRDKLHIIEQENYGGAGGFVRGLLAARDLDATHAILMDDDVVLEPEAILRTARLYALARHDFVVGGHMLDLFQPNRLYEAGARLVDHRLALQPLHQGVDLACPGSLDRFFDATAMHYNGWWFMGLPLRLLDLHGWPMPCFIRGDDVEFGRRLHDAGVPIVSTPGIGIWHEPFYAKLGGWHIYYEFRNMLALASAHFASPAPMLSRTAIRWIVAELLMFRYQRAAFLIRAVEDFLEGPGIFARKPAATHASLGVIARAHPAASVGRETVLPQLAPPIGPRRRLGFAVGVATALLSEWRRPDGTGRTIRIEPRDHLWFRVRRADRVIVDEPYEVEQPLYARSRLQFRALFSQTMRLAWRLPRAMPRAVESWHAAYATFTSEGAWRAYLGMPDHPGPPAALSPAHATKGVTETPAPSGSGTLAHH